ncbi:MAG: hypothetical protein QGG90_12990, partial [Nitrospinota bacterium]|nr:hypothetical protein [Nitrospinota bacterium]
MGVRYGGRVLGLLFLAWVGVLGGCGRAPGALRPDLVASLLPKRPRADALISLRRYLPRAV